jgi:hypothetical protein
MPTETQRMMAIQAAESGVSHNRLISSKLSKLWHVTSKFSRTSLRLAADKLTKLFEISIGKLQNTRPRR